MFQETNQGKQKVYSAISVFNQNVLTTFVFQCSLKNCFKSQPRHAYMDAYMAQPEPIQSWKSKLCKCQYCQTSLSYRFGSKCRIERAKMLKGDQESAENMNFHNFHNFHYSLYYYVLLKVKGLKGRQATPKTEVCSISNYLFQEY